MRSERRRWVIGIRSGRQKYKIIGVDKWSHSLSYPIQLCSGGNYYLHFIDEETGLRVVEGPAKVTQLLNV